MKRKLKTIWQFMRKINDNEQKVKKSEMMNDG